MEQKRIFVCGIAQESNSFNPVLADYDSFASFGIYESNDIISKGCSLPSANGMLESLKEASAEIICGTVMRAGSGGPVDSKVIKWFIDKTIQDIKTAGRLDGILIAMHGATISDKSDDVCGDIVETIRKEVGEDVPISASFDLHANITEKMMKNADYVTGFQAYPHLDQVETGKRAAKRLLDHIDGKKLKMAYCKIPMIAPAHGYTTTSGSLKKLVARAKKMIQSGEIIDYTIFEVQPWLDVKKMATTIIVIAETEDKAKAVAKDFAKENFSIRKELLGDSLFSIEEVIEKAVLNKTGKPIVLVDSADSPNAGANADSAAVIEKLLPYKDTLKCAVAVSDIPAVDEAFKLGVGAVHDFTLGAYFAPKLSKPILVKNAKVKSLHDGTFTLYGPQDKGGKRNLGKTAVLECGKILIHLSSYGKFEGDLNFYKEFGIDPIECDLVSVKACTSFRAGYEAISAEICNTNTPGAAGTVLTDLPYEKRPKLLYPFEEITEKDITEPKVYR